MLLAVVASTLSFAASPALAHDEAIEVSPAQDSTVTKGISEVSVTFGEDVMKTIDNAGLMITITHVEGDTDTYQPACMIVDGPKLSVLADLERPGLQVVHWRSVSSDGHATEGSFSFNVDGNGSHSWGGPQPAADCEVINDLMVIAPAPSPSATATPDFAEQNLPGLFVGLGFIVLASVISVVVFDRKNRNKKDTRYE